MFKGTPGIEPGEFSKIVARNGGRDNAFTSWDFTVYFQNVARDRLELVMGMEADRMVNLRLADDQVYPERDVVIEERHQRTDNQPHERLNEQAGATLFVNHPYGIPIIGWENEMKAMTREDAEAFYRAWYAPNNAILVVSGDIDAAELRPLAEKTYGRVASRPVPVRARSQVVEFSAERRVTLADPHVQQPAVELQMLAPSYHAGETADAYPLQVLDEIMSGGATGRLNRTLVVEQRLATAAWLNYNPTSLDRTSLEAGATPVPGVELPVLETALKAELARLLEAGVSDQEVATAKKRLLAAAAYARDSLQGPAYALGMALATGRTIDEVESWPERIGSVTTDQVNAAARAVLGQSGVVIAVLEPAAKPVKAPQAEPVKGPAAEPLKEPVKGSAE
jgi:zinc protease